MTIRITKSFIVTKKQLSEEITNIDTIVENLNEQRKNIPSITLFNLETDKDLAVKAKAKVQEAIEILQIIKERIKFDLKSI